MNLKKTLLCRIMMQLKGVLEVDQKESPAYNIQGIAYSENKRLFQLHFIQLLSNMQKIGIMWSKTASICEKNPHI